MAKKNITDNNGQSVPIERFDLSKMVSHPSIVMIAKRGSGKSWAVKAIMHHFRKIPVGLVIAPTDRMNCFYANFFPDSYIFYSYNSNIIEKLLFRQLKIIEKNEQREKDGKRPIDSRAMIVMDDCLAQKGSWVRDGPIMELLFNGRHYKIMYILTMQYPLGIIPELRTNFDYIFLMAEDFITNLKRIHDHYAGMFPNFDSFRQIFSQLTENFGALVIANRGARKTFLEKIFWYRAPSLEDIEFKMGSNQFRDFHKENYDSGWRIKSQNKAFDINEYCANRKRSNAKFDVTKKM